MEMHRLRPVQEKLYGDAQAPSCAGEPGAGGHEDAPAQPGAGETSAIRFHPVHANELWLENLADYPVDYDFTLQGRRFRGHLPPLAVFKA